MSSASEFQRRLRAAQRQAEQQMRSNVQRAQREAAAYARRVEAAQTKAIADWKRAVQAQDRANQRKVDQHNQQAVAHNKRVISEHNRKVETHNRRADAHNRRVIEDLNRQFAARGRAPVSLTEEEWALVERVHDSAVDDREYDVFLNHAKIDGHEVSAELCRELQALKVSVWFDAISIRPGTSQALQMDQGLRRSRAGVVVLTPAYLAGRFWPERELGVLLGKPTCIPVLHNVTFDDVAEYSGMLPDLGGFETARDSVSEIAAKIAAAVRPWDAAADVG